MKKTYINPSLEIIKMATRQIIAASQLGVGAEGSANVAEGRRGYFDDEDEE